MSWVDKAVNRIVENYKELPDNAKHEVIDKIKYDSILTAAEEVKKSKTVLFGDVYAEAQERTRYFNKHEGSYTGIRYFDRSIMGLRPGELIILAAPPNFGKTSVALNIIVSTVLRNKFKALIISMEMTYLEIATRVYNMADVSAHEDLMETIAIQTELAVSAKHIMAMIEREKPNIIMLDHIQFLANQMPGNTEYERINAAVASLKRIAINYELPIIAISHVSKTRSGKDGEATAADLNGSAHIEQDCDVGFMINRLPENVTGDQIVVRCFKHRTKKPDTFHKSYVLTFSGVRLVNNYRQLNEKDMEIMEEVQEVSDPFNK